jgi:predicted Rossmann fold nucleotide-binding protein DprA/Smf involved in DNA uptake
LLRLFKKGKQIHLEEIIEHTELKSSDLAYLLLELEMKALIKAMPGKKFSSLVY